MSKWVPLNSGRSVLTPVRRARPGEKVVTTIRGVGYTACERTQAEMMSRVPRGNL